MTENYDPERVAHLVAEHISSALMAKWGAYIRHAPMDLTPPIHLYPSQIGRCLLQQYYTYLYGDPSEPDEKAAFLMLLGRALHQVIEESLLGRDGGQVKITATELSFEYPVNESAVFVGRADVMMEVEKRPVVVELKTVQYAPQFPSSLHVLQTQTYIHALNAELGVIYYFERATGAHRGFVIARDDALFDYVVGRARQLVSALMSRTPPPPEPGEWCSYCMFRARCPITAGARVAPGPGQGLMDA